MRFCGSFADIRSRISAQFLEDLDVQVTFRKDAKGTVTGMIIDQAGRPPRELKKLK